MKIRKFAILFLSILTVFSFSSVFAEKYEKTVDEIIQLAIKNPDVVHQINNETTLEKAKADNVIIVDTLDAVSSGYTPLVEMKAGMNNDRSSTVFWRIKNVTKDVSALDTDERIVKEMAVINSKTTFNDKVKEINKFVKGICSYDKQYVNDKDNHRDSETAMGALNGKAICQGYSNLTSYLYERAGIQNIKVRGNDKTGGRHVWNVVRDNSGKMYVVDTTWNTGTDKYLLMSLDEYSGYCTDVFDEAKLFDLKYPKAVEGLIEINIEESVQPFSFNNNVVEENKYQKMSALLKYLVK